MGKRIMNTEQITFRIDKELLSELKAINPALVTKSTKGEDQLKFRYGALGKYLTRLVRKDIEERKKMKQDETLRKFL